MNPCRHAAHQPIDPHTAPTPRPGLHLGPLPVDPELRRRVEAANEAGFSTVIDRGNAEELEQLLQAAEARGLV